MVKFALIAIAILAFQLALGVFLGKCIRAGRGPDLDEFSQNTGDLDAVISRMNYVPIVVPPLAPKEHPLEDWPVPHLSDVAVHHELVRF